MELLLSPVDAAKRLGIGRTRMFALIKAGEVCSVKIGGSRRVTAESLDAYVKRLVSAAN